MFAKGMQTPPKYEQKKDRGFNPCPLYKGWAWHVTPCYSLRYLKELPCNCGVQLSTSVACTQFYSSLLSQIIRTWEQRPC